MRKSILTSLIAALMLALSGCQQETEQIPAIDKDTAISVMQEVKEIAPAEEVFSPSFEASAISEETVRRITGVSWREGSPAEIEDLRYVEVAYWGFDEKRHRGELIVNKAVADEVAEIFKELYEARFPIEKIRLIDEYSADDSKSMEDNNTSSFCFREVEGKPGMVSKHAYGLAIDINPVQNPYIYKKEISPKTGAEYTDRENVRKGMIVKNDVCYEAFISKGWTWGGDWKHEKDYQHFQKTIKVENE